MSSLCTCPHNHRCPKHHLDIGVVPGRVYKDEDVRTYSGYCMWTPSLVCLPPTTSAVISWRDWEPPRLDFAHCYHQLLLFKCSNMINQNNDVPTISAIMTRWKTPRQITGGARTEIFDQIKLQKFQSVHPVQSTPIPASSSRCLISTFVVDTQYSVPEILWLFSCCDNWEEVAHKYKVKLYDIITTHILHPSSGNF